MESIGGGVASGALRPVMLTSGPSGRVWALFSVGVLRSLLLLLSGLMLLLLLPFRRRTIVVATEEKQDTGTVTGVRKGAEEKREAMVVRVPAAMVPRRARELDVAARRAMAIRRVRGGEQGEVGSCLRDFALFSTERGDTLFTQSWSSVSIRTDKKTLPSSIEKLFMMTTLGCLFNGKYDHRSFPAREAMFSAQ